MRSPVRPSCDVLCRSTGLDTPSNENPQKRAERFERPTASYVVEQYFADFKPGDSSAQQVINRLNGMVANPVFEALFDSDRSTFNMFDEIQAAKLIVINASASNQLYARFWIEQVASCITPRFKLPFEKRMPTTFILDEKPRHSYRRTCTSHRSSTKPLKPASVCSSLATTWIR